MTELTAATKAVLDLRLRIRGIAEVAYREGWRSGPWTVRKEKSDEVDHIEVGWYCPVYKADGEELWNPARNKSVKTFKNADSQRDPKNTWCNYISNYRPLMLPRTSVFGAVKGGRLNVCEGHADFLSMLAAGIPNVCGIFGASFVPTDIGKQWESWGVKCVRVFFHGDAAGAKMAQKLCDYASSLLEIHYYALPVVNGKKYDLNVIWQSCDFNRRTFREICLPALDEYRFTPKPVKEWKPVSYAPCTASPSRIHAYGLGVLRSVTADLAKVENSRNDALYLAAAKLGNYVGAGVLERRVAEADLMAVGIGLGLSQNEVTSTLRSGLNKGIENPADLSKLGERDEPKRKPTAVERKVKQLETAARHAPAHEAKRAALSEDEVSYINSLYVKPRKARGEK